MNVHHISMESPLGELRITGDGRAVTSVHMAPDGGFGPSEDDWVPDDGTLEQAVVQLDEYFAGRRTSFALPLAPRGTPFQHEVWAALREIPYGRTTSYGELARSIGRPGASRAVGLANGRNPIAVIVPCHRVIGADGSLTGYAGGSARKRLLLDLEARSAPAGQASLALHMP